MTSTDAVYGYMTYCMASGGGPSSFPPWCHAFPPSLYSFVQSTYWDVGFLRFYRHLDRVRCLFLYRIVQRYIYFTNHSYFLSSTQWPWVLQSAPVFSLALAAFWTWASYDWKRAFTLGLFPFSSSPPPLSSSSITTRSRRHAASNKRTPYTYMLKTSPLVAPFFYHLAGMTVIAALVMHVNVATRFLSSSPVLYWYMACVLLDHPQHTSTTANRHGYLVRSLLWGWALTSMVLGCILFPNFYPWT